MWICFFNLLVGWGYNTTQFMQRCKLIYYTHTHTNKRAHTQIKGPEEECLQFLVCLLKVI